MANTNVLVTGGSSFIGSHCVVALLNAGYGVRATVRSPEREADLRHMVARAGANASDTLTFAIADLTFDDQWPEAVDGSDFVLHVASPYPPDEPDDESEVIAPCPRRDHSGAPRCPGCRRQKGCPHIVIRRSLPWPRHAGNGSSVRDVADIHVRAPTHPGGAYERFIACCDGSPITMDDAARILHEWIGAESRIRSPILGEILRPSNRKAKAALGFTARPIDEALLSTAASLIRTGLAPAP